jgi:hypothetical protein
MKSKIVFSALLFALLGGLLVSLESCKKKKNWILPITIIQNDDLYYQKNLLLKLIDTTNIKSPEQQELLRKIRAIETEIKELPNWRECGSDTMMICPTCPTMPTPGCCEKPKPSNGIILFDYPCILSKRKLNIIGYSVSKSGDCYLYCPIKGKGLEGGIDKIRINFEGSDKFINVNIDKNGYIAPDFNMKGKNE